MGLKDMANKGMQAARSAQGSNPEELAAQHPDALVVVTSHDEGRNATVALYQDRIERVLPPKMMSISKRSQETETTPLRSVSNVQSKKDGMRYTKVVVHATGNPIEFRCTHDDAQRLVGEINKLIV